MALFKADRLCMLCSYRSIEWNQFGKTNKDGVINALTHQETNTGLICTQCNGFVCLRCIEKILPHMSSDSHHFISTELLKQYENAVSMPVSSFSTPPDYIGHCCIVSNDISSSESSVAKPQPGKDSESSPSFCQHHQEASNQVRNGRESIALDVGRLSGCIFFPEFGVFIDSPIDCMDIHSVGPEYRYSTNQLKRDSSGKGSCDRKKECYLPGRWHCVIPHEVAIEVNNLAPESNATIPNTWRIKNIKRVKINLPHDISHIKKETFNLARKASNTPTVKELQDSYLFKNFGPFRKEVDVTIVLGTDSSTSEFGSILLCRFHKMPCFLSPSEKEDLLSAIWQSMKKNKFECRRRGGSSGFISNDTNVVKKFMSYPGGAPRNGKGVIWIRGTDTWYLYYIGTYDNKAKVCQYTNPVPGGSFKFNYKRIQENKILAHFISIKPIAALIIESIQGKLRETKDFNFAITPEAVRAELMNIAETRSVIHSSKSNIPPLDLKPVPKRILKMNKHLKFYAIYNRDHVKFTMVVHPVGFHLDTFADKFPSLENKFCVEMMQVRINQKTLMNTHPHGRGGGKTSKHFVFGLLDWSGGQRAKRQVWTDPANAHLDHAPQDPHQTLTRTIWRAFYRQDLVHVPNGVDRRRLRV